MSAYICNPEHFGILAAYAAQNCCVIREWDRTKRPTAEQYAELEKHGIKPKDVENFGHATALLALAWQRRFNGQTSLKQANMLAKNGLDPNMSREQASVEISKLMERWKGWKASR